MDNIKIKEIQFGKTDAYNEFSELGPEMFVASFYNYSAYNIQTFIDGKNYFLCGDKGTGKSAMLKYLQVKLSKDLDNVILPIRFKSDFDENDRKSLLFASGNIREDIAEGYEKISTNDNTVLVWQIYLINMLFSALSQLDYKMFKSNKDYKNIEKLLHLIYSDDKTLIIPSITRGKFNINANAVTGLDAQIEIEIGFDKKQQKADFPKTAKKIIELFNKLEYTNYSCYILCDELELSVRSTKQFNRDLQLVRDLIIAVYKTNEICKNRSFPIHIIASVRNEVVNSAINAGYELNKLIEDFGVKISWYKKGSSHRDNQLIKIIENKISASEKALGVHNATPVWERYFPDFLHSDSSRKFILNNTWLRPRDIVRLLSTVQKQADEQKYFTESMFNLALQEYSIASWTELCEELCLKYSNREIDAIKKVFTNIQVPFTFKYLTSHVRDLSEIYDYVDDFFKKYKLVDLLESLFLWGVIGNTGQRMVFRFLGDLNFSPTEDMIIHTPLRRLFAVTSRPKSSFAENIYTD